MAQISSRIDLWRENMFILATTRLLLAILVSVPFQMVGTVALPNGDVPQSENSTPRHGQVRSSGLEMLTDTEGIDFNPYLLTALLSVRQNWYAVIPPSVESGQQGTNTAEFRILQDGKVPMDFLKLTVHSGKEDFDKASLTAIRASTPFSHLPEKFSGPFLVVHITFDYNVSRTAKNDQGRKSTKSTLRPD
jgi:TonB C terminal